MDTEVIATSAVKASISVTDYLAPYINERDKEPIWDGNIYVFSNKNKSNKSCKGRVPVQIKSKQSNDLSKDKITYPIRIDDLNKYLADNGAIYFVVYINNDGSTRIYYNDLLPFKIKQLLEGSEEKKTRSAELVPFPNDNKEKVDLFLNFLRDREQQKSINNIKLMSIEELASIGHIKELSFGFTSSQVHKYSPFDYLFSHSVYLYATIPLGIKIPVNIISEVLCAETTLNKPVYSNGTKYYESYHIIHKKDADELHFGKSIVFKLIRGSISNTMNFKLNGTLRERINDEGFLIDMIESSLINIDGLDFPVKTDSPEELENFNVKRLKEHLKHLKKVREALDKAGVKDDLNCNNLSHKDEIHIRMLVDAFVNHNEIDFGESVIHPISKITIANLCIMVIARKQETGFYILSNFFSEHVDLSVKNEEGDYLKVSQFIIMNKDNFLNLSNIDYDAIYNDIIKFDRNSIYEGRITQLLLEMLHAYDEEKTKNKELLDTAYRLSKWLMTNCSDMENTHISLLNYLQTVKRSRFFNEKELEQLHSLIESGNITDAIMTGAYILLENCSGARLHYNKLTLEEKQNFTKYPIYNLWEKRD